MIKKSKIFLVWDRVVRDTSMLSIKYKVQISSSTPPISVIYFKSEVL